MASQYSVEKQKSEFHHDGFDAFGYLAERCKNSFKISWTGIVFLQLCTERLQHEMDKEDEPDGVAAAQPPSSKSLVEVYLGCLKPLQFGEWHKLCANTLHSHPFS